MKRNIIFSLLLLGAILVIQGCSSDEGTFEIKQAFTTPTLAAPVASSDGTILFDAAKGTVDLKWDSENAGGDAVSWSVYFGSGKVPALYKSGVTENKITVPVIDGQTYRWYVTIKDSRGVVTTSPTWSFISINGLNPKIKMTATTTTDVQSSIGVDLTPDQVVKLRWYIVDKASMTAVKTFDNGTSSLSDDSFTSLPNGEYLVGFDVKSTLNAGDLNNPVLLSVSLGFEQLGLINQTLDFVNVANNSNPCAAYRTYLAAVKKAGSVYTITKSVSYVTPQIIRWLGTDATYASQVSSTEDCSGKTITGLGFGWMNDWWGETIIKGGTLKYTVSGSTITIPYQYYCTTTYNGAAQPDYYIQGTGTIDSNGNWKIHYDFKQGTTWIGNYCYNNYGWVTDGFDATLSQQPI